MNLPKEFLTDKQASEYLGISRVNLRKLRSRRKGPTYLKFNNGHIAYRIEDLEHYRDRYSSYTIIHPQ